MSLPATPWYHCQGQIVSFSATSKGCKECPLAKECAIEVRQRLLSLQERIDGLIGSANCKFDSTRDFSGLSHHARRIATAVERAGIDMAADARHGTNSFKSTRFRPEYMAEIQELLNTRKPFTSREVKLAIGRVVELSPSSINNCSSFVISAMEALGVITQVGGGLYAPN